MDLIVAGSNDQDENLDPSSLRYVLYARKSTTGEDRQEKSIDQQISDCMARVIEPLGIDPNNLIIIQEKGSAKEPDIRPEFTRMIELIKEQRVDGIIAWHPDRLSRNMKEAGEIIDLLDKRVIKDLKFATYIFENSPNGKMTLGIQFVLSKQYSEHLSESVKRGNEHWTSIGAFLGKLKHGYYITNERYLYPDGGNFLTIQKAFRMRLEGASQESVATWINSQNYTVRRYNQEPKIYHFTKERVSDMLSDPVYAGVLIYGKAKANLEDYYNFEPVVTVDDFLKINKVHDFKQSRFASRLISIPNEKKAKLLNGMIICGHCGKKMSAGITTKKSRDIQQLRYRCDTDGCLFKDKSARAKTVIDFALNTLEKYQFTTRTNYDKYVDEMKEYMDDAKHELTRAIQSSIRELAVKRDQYQQTKEAASTNEQLAHHLLPMLDKLESDIDKSASELKKLKEKREHLPDTLLTYEKYLELITNVANLLRSNSNTALYDTVLRKFYSNFTLKAEYVGPKKINTRWEVAQYEFKEPYAEFLKSDNYNMAGETGLEPATPGFGDRCSTN